MSTIFLASFINFFFWDAVYPSPRRSMSTFDWGLPWVSIGITSGLGGAARWMNMSVGSIV